MSTKDWSPPRGSAMLFCVCVFGFVGWLGLLIADDFEREQAEKCAKEVLIPANEAGTWFTSGYREYHRCLGFWDNFF